MPPAIIKLSDAREALKARIAAAKAQHKSAADAQARLRMLTVKQLRAEIRAERKAS